jgi:uncharacterized protein YcaQ
VGIDHLRAFAVSRSLFRPVSLQQAIDRLGFVQADPIRAPARAQDLTLRHRVRGYRAGQLERQYGSLDVEEDVLINYGFVSRRVHALMHPRDRCVLPAVPRIRKHKVVGFVRERGEAHPRDVDAHFAHGTVTNYWGGSSNATTRMLEDLHYRGWLRVARRDRGIRVYAPRETRTSDDDLSPRERVEALVDVVVKKYAPLPSPSLSYVVGRLRYAVPQWRGLLKAALARARECLAHEHVAGVEWYWPLDEDLRDVETSDSVRLLAPFDPVVWDRRRFEMLWGWDYRFEAYTPASKRRFGYYALPMLWRDRVIGWANVSLDEAGLRAQFGYVAGTAPRNRLFTQQRDAEIERLREFLREQRTANRE